MRLNLLSRDWKLQGWRPFYWQARRSLETGGIFSPEFGPYPAVVPGSAHTTLRKENVIPDWNVGRQSLDCEWVEHRHWEFFTEFTAGEMPAGEKLVLEADGLDYSGWILVDTTIVAIFRGALLRHQFDLSALNDGKAHRLSIIFDVPPEEQGQIGRTTQSRFFKPRYNFSWDWCVRVVPTGIWDQLTLVSKPNPIEVVSVRTETAADLKSGEVIVRFHHRGKKRSKVEVALAVAREVFTLAPGKSEIRLPIPEPGLWWPNGTEESALYEMRVTDIEGKELLYTCRVGFKHVRWLPCEGAPGTARPLLCEINGRPVFLQGINWTPIRLDYPGTKDDDYRRLINLYQEMGCNLLRVWGGGYLEKEIFYRLCDEAGLMVWQEFPLSSSGIDNEAPSDPAAIADLEKIATDYIRRRSNHPSLLTWCGGNELQTVPKKKGEWPVPLRENHPALAALLKVVNREQPGIRFFPTSPSGPFFSAARERMGKGVNHHVHGPWDHSAPVKEWRDYWSHDDSMLRAETGVTGTSSVELIKRYAGEEKMWPPTVESPLWRHSSAWWGQWKILKKAVEKLPPAKKLARFVELSQKRQADYLAFAATSCKRRFPQSSGFIIWMGHDAFPCPSNTSIIDFDLKPKPACHALAKIYKARPDAAI